MNPPQESGLIDHPLAAVTCRFISAALSFALGIVCARYLGLEAFGAYSIIAAAVSISTVVALLGHETLAVRWIASTRGDGKGSANSYRRSAARNVLWASVATLSLVALWLTTKENVDNNKVLWALLLLVIFNARTRLSQSMIRGAHYTVKSILPDGVIRPTLAIAALIFLSRTSPPEPGYFVIVFLGSALLTQFVAVHWERSALGDSRAASDLGGQPRISWSMWLSSMLAVALSQVAMIFLGGIDDREGAALYSAAEKYAGAISMLGHAAYLTIAARLAALHGSRQTSAMADLVRKTTRYVSIAALFTSILIAANAEQLLIVFGPAFADGQSVLLILLTAATLNALAGPCGLLLQMTGHEKEHLYSMAVAVVVQIVSLLILVPENGAIGAAQSMLLANITWNALMLAYVRTRLKLNPILVV